MIAVTAVLSVGYALTSPSRAPVRMAATEVDSTAEGFGASHTSMYTDAVAKDSYETLDDVLATKMSNPDLKKVITTMFDACGTITEALRKELVTVAEKQASVFGDVQLGVDVLADDLMWDVCKTDPLIKAGASEEEPEVREMHADGKFCICWDPLDGSRTTVFVTLDDGVYEFTYGANGVDGWLCSRDRVQIAEESKIFAPANMRAAQDLPAYGKLIEHWMTNRYTLRYTGGLVPDICQQFTKRQGVFANPTSDASPAKLRLAFEAAPFGLLVEAAGGKTSDGVSGGSVLDVPIEAVDQRTALCIGSSNEVDRYNEMICKGN